MSTVYRKKETFHGTECVTAAIIPLLTFKYWAKANPMKKVNFEKWFWVDYVINISHTNSRHTDKVIIILHAIFSKC